MKRPNIVLILADDMGYSDIGCFGSEIHTPNIDSLAKDGVRCTQMYNNARCCPSRACLLTGLFSHQTGVGHMVKNSDAFPEYQGYLNDSCATIAEALQAGGYNTGMCGKWHVGGNYVGMEKEKIVGMKGYPIPTQRGFQHFYGILEGCGDYYNPGTLMEDGKWLTPKPEDDFYFTEAISRKACGMVEDMAKKEEPFFLYLAYTAPHFPLHAREKYIQKYEELYRCGWEEIRKRRYQKLIDQGIISPDWKLSDPDDQVPSWEEMEDQDFEAVKMAVYAAQIEEMDEGIGQVLEQLRKSGCADDTIVMFMSDNGGSEEVLPSGGWVTGYTNSHTLTGEPVDIGNSSRRRPGGEDTYMSYGRAWANVSNTPFRLYKHWIHEGGISTPFILSWKNGVANKGGIIRSPMHFADVMPTILEAARTEYPGELKGRQIRPAEGESFLDIVSGDWERKKPIFWEHEGNCGVRMGRYKLVRQHRQPFELYDMQTDRTEDHDLSAEHPEIVKELEEQYNQWAARIGVRPWDEVRKRL